MDNLQDEETSIGIRVPVTLKERLSRIASVEHRSLSGQALFFLTQLVERWETTHNAEKETEVSK